MTDRFPKVLAALGLIAGTAAALFYYQQGLTLSHYDAKAHLVVARRVLDSLTPEYSQIGAVWLPLPHLLNLLPVQIDAFYRTGASGVAISVLVICAGLLRDRAARALRHRFAPGGSAQRRDLRDTAGRALPAVNADDRAAALRLDASGCEPCLSTGWTTTGKSRRERQV